MMNLSLAAALRAWLDLHERSLTINRVYVVLACIAVLDGSEVLKPTAREEKRRMDNRE